jgi:hypothetical protein
MAEIDDIKKLSPEDRLRRLKELEEKRKKEANETSLLIKEAEEDIKKEKIIKEIKVPEIKKRDITELFSSEQESLEETVKKSETELPPDAKSAYRIPLEIQNELKEIYSELTSLGYTQNWTREEFHSFYDATIRLREIQNHFEEKIKHGYQLSETVTSQLVLSQAVEYNIRKYREFNR